MVCFGFNRVERIEMENMKNCFLNGQSSLNGKRSDTTFAELNDRRLLCEVLCFSTESSLRRKMKFSLRDNINLKMWEGSGVGVWERTNKRIGEENGEEVNDVIRGWMKTRRGCMREQRRKTSDKIEMREQRING